MSQCHLVRPCPKTGVQSYSVPPNRRHTTGPIPKSEMCIPQKIEGGQLRPINFGQNQSGPNSTIWQNKGNVTVGCLKPETMSELAFLEEARKMFRSNKLVALYAVCVLDYPNKY